MNNILITGSNGFIGKNLKSELENFSDIKIFEFNRNDTISYLDNIIEEIDFIFHFAGEVRPTSSDEEFNKSHGVLTKNIISLLEKKNLKIPILLTSSTHASTAKNAYGKTKRDTEDLIIEYGERNDVSVLIYRLFHVFGEGCKINYNSVISTWIYNSINNLELNIFDREIKMRYIYVHDLINNFIKELNIGDKNSDINKVFYEVPLYYDTTLGNVVDYLEEFKKNIKNNTYKIEDNNFKSKLFKVYQSYLGALGKKD